ncbi:hypothetical protein ACJ41O_005837 [Fusarium nematophilum]
MVGVSGSQDVDIHVGDVQASFAQTSEAAAPPGSTTVNPMFNNTPDDDLSALAALLSPDQILGLDFRQENESTLLLQSLDQANVNAIEAFSIDARIAALEGFQMEAQEEIRELKAWKATIDFKYAKLNEIVNNCLNLLQSRPDLFNHPAAGGP